MISCTESRNHGTVPPLTPQVLGARAARGRADLARCPAGPDHDTGRNRRPAASIRLEVHTYGLSGLFYDAEGSRAHGLNERIRVKSLLDGRRSCTR